VRIAIAILLAMGCRRSESSPPIVRDPVIADAAVDAPSDAATLTSLYGANAAHLEGRTIEPLDAGILAHDQRLTGEQPARVGWVDVDGDRMLAVLGPKMGRDYRGDPIYAQAFSPPPKPYSLDGVFPVATAYSLWSAKWHRDPHPSLLVLSDAAGAPIAARYIGVFARVSGYRKFLEVPMFMVEELGSGSGVDDPIILTVLVYRDGLEVAGRYPLGPRSTGAECDPPSPTRKCVIEPPGSVTVASSSPPSLLARFVDTCASPAESLAGCTGFERVDVWDDVTGRFVAGTPRKVTLKATIK
jgi:hypothetical protein